MSPLFVLSSSNASLSLQKKISRSCTVFGFPATYVYWPISNNDCMILRSIFVIYVIYSCDAQGDNTMQ